MILVTAATDKEIAPLRAQFAGRPAVDFLVSGVGLVETAHILTRYLEKKADQIDGVINIGVAGAFSSSSVEVLDLCLASSEVIGDMAICFRDHLVSLGSPELVFHQFFPCQGALFEQCQDWCRHQGYNVQVGAFVSVNSVSATTRRGEMLADTYQAISENMEGAAVARVCQSYELDWLEIRCMSNLVVDRDTSAWRLPEAISRCAEFTGNFLSHYLA